jgi:hypothetical protein
VPSGPQGRRGDVRLAQDSSCCAAQLAGCCGVKSVSICKHEEGGGFGEASTTLSCVLFLCSAVHWMHWEL